MGIKRNGRRTGKKRRTSSCGRKYMSRNNQLSVVEREERKEVRREKISVCLGRGFPPLAYPEPTSWSWQWR
eukprot:1429699-Pyramimonas_sp.AAC.1